MGEFLSSLDTFWGLALLAAVAFGDTLIGVGFFIFGEIAFLAAGAAYSTNASIVPAGIVLLAAWAGDVTSFFIGRSYGFRFSVRFLKRLKRRKAWRRAQTEIRNRGAIFVVISRFLGPVAWVTPFLAGTLNMPQRTFLPASACGVALGVGQFLVLGAFGAHFADAFLSYILDHMAVIFLATLMVLSGILIWRRSERHWSLKLAQAMSMALTVFFASNVLYFFVLNSHPAQSAMRMQFQSVCDATSGPFLVQPGDTSLHLPQPVNVILISERSGADLMTTLGWHRNVTFTHDQIGFFRYLKLLLESRPPVSELYLQGVPADSAHQLEGTLKVREHIRWWDMGAGVHFGALSMTEEIAIKYYGHLPVVLHDIDPKVDESRALLENAVNGTSDYRVLGLANLASPVEDNVVADYETDGGILVIVDAAAIATAEQYSCLFHLDK